MAHLNTVLGTLHPEEMGITAVHEHILFGPPGWEADPGAWFKMGKVFEKCYNDLMDFKLQGGATFIDASGIGSGRELDVHIKLASATGLHVVASTGFLGELFTAPHFHARDADYFETLFVHELTVGMGRTRVKAGVINAGGGAQPMTRLEAAQHRGAARAARKTGAAVMTHAINALDEQLAIFREEKLDPARIILGGCDTRLDLERDKRVAKAGCYVAYDHVGLESWSRMAHALPDQRRAELVKAMLDAELGDRLIVSAGSSGWVLGQGEDHLSNVGNVLRYFVPRLAAAGVAEADVRRIFADNPKRVLPIQ